MEELDSLHDIANGIMGNTICAFGEGTAMPALAFLQKFRQEFEQYVRGERKRADATLAALRDRRWTVSDRFYFYACARSCSSAGRSPSSSRRTRSAARWGCSSLILSVAGLFLALARAVPRGDPAHRLRGRDRRPLPLRHHAPRAERDAAARPARTASRATFGGGLFALVGLGALALVARPAWRPARMPTSEPPPAGFGSDRRASGAILFTDALVPFELSSALLMVAVVGAIAVARGRQGDPTLSSASDAERDGAHAGDGPRVRRHESPRARRSARG